MGSDFHRVGDLFMQTELAAEMYVDEYLTGDGLPVILDRPGSVSASECPDLHWGDPVTMDQQHRRFLNGS